MKAKAVKKSIEQDGWFLVRSKWNLRQSRNRNKRGLVTVAGYRNYEIAKATFKSILKQVGSMHWRQKVVKYAVIIEKADGNYSAYSPDLPGCVATGKTEKETLLRMKDAIRFHLEGMRREGLVIPESSAKVKYIEITI